MGEKRCWICRRNEKEVNEELEDYLAGSGTPEDAALVECDLWEMQKVFLCQGCQSIIFKMTHHDDVINEYDIVLFEDLDNLKINVKLDYKS